MNLIIDIGNSLTKIALFHDNKLLAKETTEAANFFEKFKQLHQQYHSIKHCIISSVGPIETIKLNYLKAYFNILVLNNTTLLPFKNAYKTPQTLGADRIALVCGAKKRYPYNNCLVIDAGTCITYDLITNKNNYLGGAISPGIRLRYQALHNLTANLPLLETKIPKSIIGDSTENAIHSGVILGVVTEIDGVIEDYKANFKNLTIILTGGDANFLSKQLKNSIFAHSNLLLEGLNNILEFNSNS